MDKNKESCEICSKKFGGVFSNEHQCKRCSRSVCKECCTKKKQMFIKGSIKAEEHRCCDLCLPESEAIGQYIKQYSLTLNTLSKEGKEWSELSNSDYLINKTNPRSSKAFSQSLGIHDMWSQLTPSLRELLGLLIAKFSLQDIEAMIKNVLSQAPNEQYFPLVIFLICHCDEKNAIKLISYLSNISHCIHEETLFKNITLLNSENNPLSEKELKMLNNYSNNTFKSLTNNYFADCLPIQAVHHTIVESLLCGSGEILQLSASCIIFEYRNQILSESYDEKKFKSSIFENITTIGLEKLIKHLRKLIVKKDGPINKMSQKKPENSEETLAVENKEFKDEIKETEKNSKEDEVMSKMSEAAEFIKKLESGELNEEDLSPYDLESMEKYLDMIIRENEKSLEECEQFDGLLNDIEKELYKKKESKG